MKTGSKPRRRRYVETSDFLGAIARLLRKAGERVGEADPAELRDLLALRDLVDQAIVEAVAGLRAQGTTWQDIGDAAGTTRQAAILRYGPKIEGM